MKFPSGSKNGAGSPGLVFKKVIRESRNLAIFIPLNKFGCGCPIGDQPRRLKGRIDTRRCAAVAFTRCPSNGTTNN